MRPEDREPLALVGIWLVLAALSAIDPYDWRLWALEIAPVPLALAILIPTYRRFRWTHLSYRLMFLMACVLTLGAHYTYGRVPLGEWAREAFDLQRNHYDRLGHVVQGFVPAILAREFVLRLSPLRAGPLLFFLVTCVCLAGAAFYELVEWWIVVAAEESKEHFLAMQGDPWDAQWDMLLALIGAIVSQLLLGRTHDRALAELVSEPRARATRRRELVRQD